MALIRMCMLVFALTVVCIGINQFFPHEKAYLVPAIFLKCCMSIFVGCQMHTLFINIRFIQIYRILK